MSHPRRTSPQLDLDELPPTCMPRWKRPSPVTAPPPTSSTPIPDGVAVVATAMSLSENARRRLSDEFGSDDIVDLTEAPSCADVLLVHSVSPALVGLLRRQFPDLRAVIAVSVEIEDGDLDVYYPGPVSRLLEAGASASLPPRVSRRRKSV